MDSERHRNGFFDFEAQQLVPDLGIPRSTSRVGDESMGVLLKLWEIGIGNDSRTASGLQSAHFVSGSYVGVTFAEHHLGLVFSLLHRQADLFPMPSSTLRGLPEISRCGRGRSTEKAGLEGRSPDRLTFGKALQFSPASANAIPAMGNQTGSGDTSQPFIGSRIFSTFSWLPRRAVLNLRQM